MTGLRKDIEIVEVNSGDRGLLRAPGGLQLSSGDLWNKTYACGELLLDGFSTSDDGGKTFQPLMKFTQIDSHCASTGPDAWALLMLLASPQHRRSRS